MKYSFRFNAYCQGIRCAPSISVPDNCGSKKKKQNDQVLVATFYGSIKLMLKKIILLGFKFFIKDLDCLFVKIVFFYKYSVKYPVIVRLPNRHTLNPATIWRYEIKSSCSLRFVKFLIHKVPCVYRNSEY